MGKVVSFPDPQTRAAREYDRDTNRIALAASLELSAAALRHAIARGNVTEITNAEHALRQTVERLGL